MQNYHQWMSFKKFYRDMLLIRRFEEKAGQLYGMGLIGGFCHLYIGQEAVVTGIQSVMKEGLIRITAYRNHGHMLVSGIDANEVMAELTGRAGGCSRGKGGSMHMFSIENGFLVGMGLLGLRFLLVWVWRFPQIQKRWRCEYWPIWGWCGQPRAGG